MFADQAKSNYQFQTRSMRLNGQCSSVRLEQKFWNVLDEIAEGEGISTPQFISKLHTEVFALHGEASNFASMLRCTCLIFMEKQVDAVNA